MSDYHYCARHTPNGTGECDMCRALVNLMAAEERLASRGELLQFTAARVAELESLIAAAPHASTDCQLYWNVGKTAWEHNSCRCWKLALDTGAKG